LPVSLWLDYQQTKKSNTANLIVEILNGVFVGAERFRPTIRASPWRTPRRTSALRANAIRPYNSLPPPTQPAHQIGLRRGEPPQLFIPNRPILVTCSYNPNMNSPLLQERVG